MSSDWWVPRSWVVAGLALSTTLAQAQGLPPVLPLESIHGHATVVGVTVLLVVIVVVLHYEALGFLSLWLGRIRLPPHPRVLLLIFAVLAAHVIEIWVFGLGYFMLTGTAGHGALLSAQSIGFLDTIYFSAVCFTTLGLGDIVPVGAIRFLAGTEALTGFVLITWSASFAFLEMQKFWRR